MAKKKTDFARKLERRAIFKKEKEERMKKVKEKRKKRKARE